MTPSGPSVASSQSRRLLSAKFPLPTFKEMDDLVTGQSPSAHLFLGGGGEVQVEPAARQRPWFWIGGLLAAAWSL